MTNKFKLLPDIKDGHAIERCLERARITPEEFIEEENSHAILIMHLNEKSRHWLVWVKKTSRAHVFITDADGIIYTILPPLKKGVKYGKIIQNPGKEDGATIIKSYWLVDALKAAGVEPIAALELINYLREEEHKTSPHSYRPLRADWYYCWVLRFSYEDKNGKFVRRNEQIHNLLMNNVTPNEMVLEKAGKYLGKFKNVHDVDLVIVNKDRDETYQSFGLNYLGGVVALEGGNNGI